MRFVRSTNKKLIEAWKDPVKATLVQREILKEKKILRDWYEDIYQLVSENLSTGTSNIEIGAGSSFLYEKIEGLIKANILDIPGNDFTFDATNMPFKNNEFDNIILIDVLHHFSKPSLFFNESYRTLKKGGRVILNDPYISLLSYIPWKLLHPEVCNTATFGFDKITDNDPLKDANSATATLLFHKKEFYKINPGFEIKKIVYHSIFKYWLAGGYNFPHLFPSKLLNLINLFEKLFSFSGKYTSSFIFIVLEKM